MPLVHQGGGGGGGGEGGEDGDVCDFRRLGRVQTGVVGMEILRRVGSVVDNELKKTTSNQVFFFFDFLE